MKRKVEEFLMIDELDLKATALIAVGFVLTFPIAYWVVFADFMWWLK